ncbi:MAG: ACT domain-containing protein, partial [Bacteroidota bacterium]
YVFTSVKELSNIPRDITICEIREKEGITLVLEKAKAEELGLSYTFTAAWITLNVHSALEAVGLTAAFATALGKFNISCNVIAGYYHDHIFVYEHDAQQAMEVLLGMAES